MKLNTSELLKMIGVSAVLNFSVIITCKNIGVNYELPTAILAFLVGFLWPGEVFTRR